MAQQSASAHSFPLPPASFPSSFSNNNQSSVSGGASISVPTIPVSASLPSVSGGHGSSTASGGFSELRSSNGSRKARVLYDYDAASSSELSLLADEVSLKWSVVHYTKFKDDFCIHLYFHCNFWNASPYCSTVDYLALLRPCFCLSILVYFPVSFNRRISILTNKVRKPSLNQNWNSNFVLTTSCPAAAAEQFLYTSLCFSGT